MSASGLIEISCEWRGETDKAWLIYDGSIEVWIPKSQCEADWKDGIVEMPEYLAKLKGLI